MLRATTPHTPLFRRETASHISSSCTAKSVVRKLPHACASSANRNEHSVANRPAAPNRSARNSRSGGEFTARTTKNTGTRVWLLVCTPHRYPPSRWLIGAKGCKQCVPSGCHRRHKSLNLKLENPPIHGLQANSSGPTLATAHAPHSVAVPLDFCCRGRADKLSSKTTTNTTTKKIPEEVLLTGPVLYKKKHLFVRQVRAAGFEEQGQGFF